MIIKPVLSYSQFLLRLTELFGPCSLEWFGSEDRFRRRKPYDTFSLVSTLYDVRLSAFQIDIQRNIARITILDAVDQQTIRFLTEKSSQFFISEESDSLTSKVLQYIQQYGSNSCLWLSFLQIERSKGPITKKDKKLKIPSSFEVLERTSYFFFFTLHLDGLDVWDCGFGD